MGICTCGYPEDVYNVSYGEGSYMSKKAVEKHRLEDGLGEEESNGSSNASMNTEEQPVPPQKEQAPPCILCQWFEKRLSNTMKEHVKHMTTYHLT